MRVSRLLLKDFRNYPVLEASFDPGVNLLIGDNAQGKTNLLESMIYLSRGSSYRTHREEELIRWEQDYARLEGHITGSAGEDRLVYVQNRGPRRRQLQKNGVNQRSVSAMEPVLMTVLFCPEDLMILRSGAAARRRFLDDAICQLRPKYKKALADYQKLYASKSRILREKSPGMLAVLPDFNQQMAINGAVIIHYRALYILRLNQLTADYHRICSGGNEQLALSYKTVSTIEDPLADPHLLYEKLKEHQRTHAHAELESGHCLSGPHKDDFEVLLDGRSLRSFGSQGQTRTAAIALKLAEREIVRRDTGEEPVLLLDDVLSELDRTRQDVILGELKSGQVFITCCETDKITTAGSTMHIHSGSLIQQ